jgi:hypothetical protein
VFQHPIFKVGGFLRLINPQIPIGRCRRQEQPLSMPGRELNILNTLLRIRYLSLLKPLILLLLKYLHTPIQGAGCYNEPKLRPGPLDPPQGPTLDTNLGLFVPPAFVVLAVDADGLVGGAGGDALAVPVEADVVDDVLVEGRDELDGAEFAGLLDHRVGIYYVG